MSPVSTELPLKPEVRIMTFFLMPVLVQSCRHALIPKSRLTPTMAWPFADTNVAAAPGSRMPDLHTTTGNSPTIRSLVQTPTPVDGTVHQRQPIYIAIASIIPPDIRPIPNGRRKTTCDL